MYKWFCLQDFTSHFCFFFSECWSLSSVGFWEIYCLRSPDQLKARGERVRCDSTSTFRRLSATSAAACAVQTLHRPAQQPIREENQDTAANHSDLWASAGTWTVFTILHNHRTCYVYTKSASCFWLSLFGKRLSIFQVLNNFWKRKIVILLLSVKTELMKKVNWVIGGPTWTKTFTNIINVYKCSPQMSFHFAVFT